MEGYSKVRGVQFRGTLPPLAVPSSSIVDDALLVEEVLVSKNAVNAPHNFMMAAEFEDEEAEARFVHDLGKQVDAVFADPVIEPMPATCPAFGGAVGVGRDALAAVNAGPVHAQGHRGNAIRVAVVDTGIDGTKIAVAGGWTLFPGVSPGSARPDHGTMVAANVLLTAPNAAIFDCPLLQSHGSGYVAFMSDAIRAYAEIIVTMLAVPGPMVIVNSWGMYSRLQDAPIGNPQNYGSNAVHPFNLMVETLGRANADIVFAAGNCGKDCPDGRCGPGDVGPDKSIFGANSHPDVLSVGAVTCQLSRLGYSSQGNGTLSLQKPDLVAPAHYAHSGIYPADSGTSTACPVVGGCVAALRSKASIRQLPPARIRDALRQGAKAVPGFAAGWNRDVGHGVVDLAAALGKLP
jgi:subtilisin family serine protease